MSRLFVIRIFKAMKINFFFFFFTIFFKMFEFPSMKQSSYSKKILVTQGKVVNLFNQAVGLLYVCVCVSVWGRNSMFCFNILIKKQQSLVGRRDKKVCVCVCFNFFLSCKSRNCMDKNIYLQFSFFFLIYIFFN